uniref:Uncharacterized protein n=1 Tax=Romanomermis culicivorax TaxID=13658 RepID=A0A915J9L7_ROMCU
MIHEIAPAISNEYNALAANFQLAIKRKTNENDDVAGKDGSTPKIIKEEEVAYRYPQVVLQQWYEL